MRFEEFAALHGLLIHHVEFGKWCRVPTDDHPRKKNGSYKHLGDVAFVQNYATMPECAVWTPESTDDVRIDHAEMARIRAKAAREATENKRKAADKAKWIVSKCVNEKHAYLHSKGFGDLEGLVWYPDPETNLLVIPMRRDKEIVACQLIDRMGGKKFLKGQGSEGAQYIVGTKGLDVWVEGYATGLSVHAVLAALKTPCCVHVCFSAGNMQRLAKEAGNGFVVADNDPLCERTGKHPGEAAAIETGLTYFMPPEEGTDFNDYHIEVGTLKAGLALRKFVFEAVRKKRSERYE